MLTLEVLRVDNLARLPDMLLLCYALLLLDARSRNNGRWIM